MFHVHVHVHDLGEAVAVRLAGGSELVVTQGDRFDIHFECVDASGAQANSGT